MQIDDRECYFVLEIQKYMKPIAIITLMTLSLCNYSKAVVCRTTSGGAWESASIWTCGHVPVCGDTIVISAGHDVTAFDQHDYYTLCSQPMYINVLGTLIIKTGKKLMLPVGSVVEIQVGGSLQPGGGGGSSNLIDIGGINVWKASDGVVNGYAIFQIPLPVELLKYEVSATGNAIEVNWMTASERNNQNFMIDKSKNGFEFEPVGVVNGAGNSNAVLRYSIKDDFPYHGTSYYRISQTDYNGNKSFLNLASIDFIKQADLSFVVYPNPNDGNCFSVEIFVDAGRKVNLFLSDDNGRSIYSTEFYPNGNEKNILTFCSEKKMSSGTYFITISYADEKYSKMVIVE
ncbi:MAG TPA: T9SS type A sorting domain-containing protein [Bacteroidia bacterium]